MSGAAGAPAAWARPPPLPTRRTGARRIPLAGELERLVLFIVAMEKEAAPALLDGLARHDEARALAASLLGAGSEERRARVGVCFGESPVAASNLRQALLEAGPSLRGELVRRLPRYLRPLFPELRPGLDAAPPATRALADRLVRLAAG